MSRKFQRASSYMEPTNATQGIFNLVDQKEKTISQINDNLYNKKYEIANLNVAKDSLLIKIQQLETQIEDLKKQNNKLHNQVSDLRKKNDELIMNSTYNNTIEVQHLRQDNQRLVKLLRENGATLPYGNDPIRYLSFVGELSQIPKEAEKLIKESLLWVPAKAYEFAVQFKSKYDSEYLSDQQIQLLLFELNKIWSERESTYVKNIKSQCAREKQSIERKSHKPYNEFMLTQQIDRMNKDLKDLQIENIELYANRPLRGADSLQKQRDRLKQQLSTNVQDKKQKRPTHQHKSQTHVNNDKKSFIDGAIWMGKKLETQIENNQEKQKLKSEIESVNQMYRNL